MRKTGFVLLALILLLGILAGCSGGNNGSGGEQAEPSSQSSAGGEQTESGEKPVTLKVLRAGITVTETEFEKVLVERTKEKFPHVTLEWVDAPEDVELEPLITSGEVPDIMFVSTSSIATTLKDLDLAENLQPYIEKHGTDLSRLKPVVLDTITKYSPEEGLAAIPFSVNLPVLFYNKDIFDKFGVAYPPNEQMSWNEAIELGKQVTRSDNGVDYVGIDLFGASNIATGLDLFIVDPETGKADVTTPEWHKVFEQLKKSYEVQGYIGADGRYQYANDDDIFYNEQNLAMVAYNIAHLLGPLEELRQQGVELNWDFAPFPNFEENLGTGKAANVHSLIVTKASQNKDIAFQVIANVLSDESQTALAKVGRVPTVEGKQFEDVYGQDIPVLQGKTVENIFKAPPRNVIRPHKFESKVRKFLEEAEKNIAVGGQDVNTALRVAQESIEKELETLNNTN
ncbi:ABC transporter substrate-binding protein [Paenibacillus soyae]|uniref:Extracellular solute-binding protein n=1 Tax=Paenibacillus soyae TaxID=2969249 RepID=A0A9X2MQR7_9BACL|nr:extracellular solute-binding protein [Paenibacillus soyae]MCR2804690.1 extracellular solute-binding protein [Paenibacillus soyae]